MTRTFGSATLHLGDCHAIAPALTGIDALVSDPPYGIGHQKGSGGHGKHNRRNLGKILGDDQPFDPGPWLAYPSAILWGADHFAQRLPRGRWLVWDKLAGMPSFDSFSDVEVAWNNRPGASRLFSYLWKGICQQGDKEGGRVHPSQKPVPLMAWCLDQAGVAQGQTVLDPFMGSGSTGIACLRTGRRFIGIEKDEAHFLAACARFEAEIATPQLFNPEPAKSSQSDLAI